VEFLGFASETLLLEFIRFTSESSFLEFIRVVLKTSFLKFLRFASGSSFLELLRVALETLFLKYLRVASESSFLEFLEVSLILTGDVSFSRVSSKSLSEKELTIIFFLPSAGAELIASIVGHKPSWFLTLDGDSRFSAVDSLSSEFAECCCRITGCCNEGITLSFGGRSLKIDENQEIVDFNLWRDDVVRKSGLKGEDRIGDGLQRIERPSDGVAEI